MDYALSHALSYNMTRVHQVLSFYDINCQYMKNLRKQLTGNAFINIPAELPIVPSIRIWHVHSHQTECHARYAPSFIPGAGHVDGEIIETLWSILNIISPSARGMSFPHRQELLDYQMNNSNFQKMIRMASSLKRKLRVAMVGAEDSLAAFQALDDGIPDDQRNGWLKQEMAAMRDCSVDPKAMDVFGVCMAKAPSVKTIEISLLAREPAAKGCRGSVTWIARGLLLEQTQIMLQMDLKEAGPRCTERQLLLFARRRDRLSGEIASFLADAPSYLGPGYNTDSDEGNSGPLDEDGWDSRLDDEPPVGPLDGCTTKSIHLPLPLALGVQRCQHDSLEWLAEQEMQLRTGQANDTLHKLRLALADEAVLFHTDVRYSSSQAMSSRAWGRMMAINVTVNEFTKIYRASR
ncbi:hypothetical protein PAXRUDRAFT_21586 [Paxillus rubicundulus Ve08.2h10]|uniref:Uncharacterized protein n=1 Tax=Paxillus rubicundulus Ve08.2h10 TaxID=930991 RepID=A0A0D0CB80_9AGAM|nr:hypothetical protein PAXRUDRAFT_21586 [Paxillus rubicundulus Ve08.2h10]